MQEIWKPIKNYESSYQVSNLGRIKRIYKNRPEKILKPVKGSFGYLYHSISSTGKSKTIRLHRIVAESFIPNPKNYPEVNHIDGNKENNLPSNLEWCTRSHNMKHAYCKGLVVISNKTRDKISNILKQKGGTTNKKVINTETGEIFNSIKEAAKSINLVNSTLCAMLSGRNPNKTKMIYYNPKENIK